MPGTTPTFGWPHPSGTDPVADGAQAVEDLALAVEGHVNFPAVLLGKSAPQTIATSSHDTVTWDYADRDDLGAFSSGSGTVTLPSGLYLIAAGCQWTADSGSGVRAIYVDDGSGECILGSGGPGAVANPAVNNLAGARPFLHSGGSVVVKAWQNSGGPLDIEYQRGTAGAQSTWFAAVQLVP